MSPAIGEEITPGEEGRRERRRYPRLNTSVQLELLAEGAAPIRTKTNEISLGGCYVETMFTLPIGTNLTILLWLDDKKVSTSGRVVSRFPQVGNGVCRYEH
jgi:c-di-GMP-binding flagellar brake protein YcgR